MPNAAAILHLSDLHLGRDFEDIGMKATDVQRTARSYWRRGGLVMQAHDPFIIASLRTNIRMAARRLGLAEDKFDLMVVTGDISTTADSEERFRFARSFLTSSFTYNSIDIGLRFAEDRVLCIPGNHDKMNEETCARYLTHFDDLPSKPPYVLEKRFNGVRFVFYGIDSNLYEEGNVALGKIRTETLAWLAERKDESQQDSARPLAVRILLLHHHPCDLNKFRKRTLMSWFTGRLSRLEEGDRLLDLCRGWIDIIMHGHEHFPVAFRDDVSGAVVVSAGTTSESHLQKWRNSFFALVFQNDSVTVSEFRWGGGQFRLYGQSTWQHEISHS